MLTQLSIVRKSLKARRNRSESANDQVISTSQVAKLLKKTEWLEIVMLGTDAVVLVR